MKKKLTRNCPVCSSSIGAIIHNQSFAHVEGSPLPTNYDIVNCLKCGFVFADSSSSQNDYNLYYSILSKYEDSKISSGSGFNQNDYDRLERTAETLERHIKKDAAILDLGCANGGQLKVLKERGFSNLTGVDPSKKCVENVKNEGIEAIQAHLFEHSFINWEKKFDLIILSHVLEHIRDLEESIQIAKDKLSENGILYIEVPDASRYNDFYIVPYYYVDCEHINHFSKVSLTNLLQKFGFKSIETYQGKIRLNNSTDYPYFYSLFILTNSTKSTINFDNSVLNSFSLFLADSIVKNNIDLIIHNIVISQEEVVIWGAGQFALRLLSSGKLSQANIIGFIDTDSSKQNKPIGEYKVFAPEFLRGKNCTLLICSALHADDIVFAASQINKSLKYFILK